MVINATGVFADQVRRMDEPDAAALVAPSQGVHLVLPDAFLPGQHALMIPKTDDGRVLFVVPWHRRALRRDHRHAGSRTTSGAPAAGGGDRLPARSRRAATSAATPRREDVLSVYVGLRPLVRPQRERRAPASLSRDHSIFESESGLVTIVGGKWTTYRKMGEDVVDHAARVAGLRAARRATAELRLHGAPLEEHVEHSTVGTPSEMLAAYGTDADRVRDLAEQDPALAVPMHPRLPYLMCEVVWAARQEMARSVEDVLSRRTRALVLDARAALECAPAVAQIIAGELGRDEAWVKDQVSAFERRARESLL